MRIDLAGYHKACTMHNGCPKITFETTESSLKILHPYKGFREDFHRVEVRKDPLLGHKSIYNANLREKVKFFFADCDEKLIQEMIATSAKTCPFCPDNLDKSTPKYPRELIPEGRLRLAEAVLFPNLYPIGKYHSVICLTNVHFLNLSQFIPSLIEHGFVLAQRFVNLLYARDPKALYVAINANYLFPAGATLVHPHLQMLVTPDPLTHHENLIEAGEQFYRKHGTPYFLDLISEERGLNMRYIAQEGRWHWIAAFSPIGMNEIMAIHEDTSDFGSLMSKDLADLAYGISRVLQLYETLGYLSFNYSLMSVRSPHVRDSYRCLIRIINRQNLYLNYRNDDYFLQKLLHSDFIINTPEDLAKKLRQYF